MGPIFILESNKALIIADWRFVDGLPRDKIKSLLRNGSVDGKEDMSADLELVLQRRMPDDTKTIMVTHRKVLSIPALNFYILHYSLLSSHSINNLGRKPHSQRNHQEMGLSTKNYTPGWSGEQLESRLRRTTYRDEIVT
jgi:hypothetical protein